MKSSQLLKILKKDGWYIISQTGSHMKLEHDVKTTGPIVFPFHGSKEVGMGLENKILKQAGLK